MTLATLRTLCWQRLDEPTDGTGYYDASQITDAVNWAQRFFVLLTLCLENSASFTLTAATCWYKIRTTVTDWLVPLRVEYGTSRVRPARLQDLESLSATWQASTGSPERYACLGLDTFAIYKQLAAGGTITLTYARIPTTLVLPTASPEIPEEYHELLVDSALVYLRMKEGGQEFQKTAPGLQRFLEGARKLGAYVRARSLDQRYDRIPPDLERIDWSRLVPAKGKIPSWLITSPSRPAPEQS